MVNLEVSSRRLGPLLLGMSGDDVLVAMGSPDHPGEPIWSYYRNGIQIAFDDTQRVMQLVANRSPSDLLVHHEGVDLFRADPMEVVAHLSRHDKPLWDGASPDESFTVVFLQIPLQLWRPEAPADLTPDIADIEEYQEGTHWTSAVIMDEYPPFPGTA